MCIRDRVKPEIEPFSFNLNTVNGKNTAKVLCTVITGDLPIDIKWLKNGHPLTASSAAKNLSITQLDDMMVMLRLSTLTVNDSGNYTCLARNTAGEARYTTTLYVKGLFTLSYWIYNKFSGGVTRRHFLADVVSRDLPLGLASKFIPLCLSHTYTHVHLIYLLW